MQLVNVVQLALLAASQAVAAPVVENEARSPNGANVLTKRAHIAPVTCGPPSNEGNYPLQSVQDAFNELSRTGNLPRPQRPAAGGRYYARQYGQGSRPPTDQSVVSLLDAIPECSTTLAGSHKWYEFPITDPLFAGGAAASQGPDRVVAIAPNVGPGQQLHFTYCLAMSHRGQAGGAFGPCADVTPITVEVT